MNIFRSNYLLLCIAIFSCSIYAQNNLVDIQERISFLIKQVNNEKLNDSVCYQYSKEAYILSNKLQNDSLRRTTLQQYVLYSVYNKNWKKFFELREIQMSLAKKFSDSLIIAETLDCSGYYHFLERKYPDSTYYYYYQSSKLYQALGDSLRVGKALMNIAISQKNSRIYKTSEHYSIEALRYLEPLGKKRWVASLYNNLGIIAKEYKDWDESLKYHIKALTIRRELADDIYYLQSLNNIGRIYKYKEEYSTAKEYFNRALAFDSLMSLPKTRKLKAMVIDNLAHTRFKENTKTSTLNDLQYALSIREKYKFYEGMIISYIHLAEYYQEHGDKSFAKSYAKKAFEIANTKHVFRDYLESLELLFNVCEGDEAKTYMNRYKFVRDSLEQVDNKYQGNIERIKYEVDKKNQEIIFLKTSTKNKNKTILTLIILVCSATLGFLFYWKIKRSQLEKSKEALQKTEHQLLDQTLNLESKEAKEIDEFHHHLSMRYSITKKLIEYWKLRADRFTNQQIADKLGITLGGAKKRNNLLLKQIFEVDGKQQIDKFFLRNLYAERLRKFKNE